MLWSLLSGCYLVLVVSIWALVTGDVGMIYQVCGAAGIGSVLVAAVLMGATLSGPEFRAAHAYESGYDRSARVTWATYLFLFGLPNLLTAAVLMYG